MIESWAIVLIHQVVFQGMFVAKNIILKGKIGKPIRGKNREATASIIFFTIYNTIALVLSIFEDSIGEIKLLSNIQAMILGLVLLFINLAISLLSLIDLKDSWRVGVIENQKTELVSSGIYRFSRNPYFLSYLFMFAAYTVLLQNAILLGLSVLGFYFIHKMILKEEAYLYSTHGDVYEKYKEKVPRYIIV